MTSKKQFETKPVGDPDKTVSTENSLYLFDSSAELSKSVVRELFIVQSWMLDGACAAILHLTQSSKLNDYLNKRKKRISIKHAQLCD